jgi:hypothetical protein
MVNFVAKSTSFLVAKSALKQRIAEMRVRLKQRIADRHDQDFQQKQTDVGELFVENDSGLVDSELLYNSTKQNSSLDDSLDMEMVSIFNNNSKGKAVDVPVVTLSRTSTPICGRSAWSKANKNCRKSCKRAQRASPYVQPCRQRLHDQSSKFSMNYIDLNRNNDLNYNINNVMDLFYTAGNQSNVGGFQDFGGLKVWYV